MRFKIGTLYKETLPVTFGEVPIEILNRVLTDGRAINQLVMQHFVSVFSNLQMTTLKTPQGRDYPVVIDNAGKVFQVRALTEHGVDFTPAKNVGYGRSFDIDEYRARLEQLDGFLVADVRRFPAIAYGIVLEEDIPYRAKFSSSLASVILESNNIQVKELD
jgi:hypothetical protein